MTFWFAACQGTVLDSGDPVALNVMTAIRALDKEPGWATDTWLSTKYYASFAIRIHSEASTHTASSIVRVAHCWIGHNRGIGPSANDLAFSLVFALEVLVEFLPRVESVVAATYGGREDTLYRDTNSE